MVMKKQNRVSTSIDASLGLVYRLNNLWRNADMTALRGDLDEYNDILNRIFVNLLYKVPMNIEYENGSNKIKNLDWGEEDKLIFDRFKEMIREVKREEAEAIKKKDKMSYTFIREKHYEILLKKDTWLRKFMMERGLYLKEVEFDPTNALWGG
jgi:hypothetical protein